MCIVWTAHTFLHVPSRVYTHLCVCMYVHLCVFRDMSLRLVYLFSPCHAPSHTAWDPPSLTIPDGRLRHYAILRCKLRHYKHESVAPAPEIPAPVPLSVSTSPVLPLSTDTLFPTDVCFLSIPGWMQLPRQQLLCLFPHSAHLIMADTVSASIHIHMEIMVDNYIIQSYEPRIHRLCVLELDTEAVTQSLTRIPYAHKQARMDIDTGGCTITSDHLHTLLNVQCSEDCTLCKVLSEYTDILTHTALNSNNNNNHNNNNSDTVSSTVGKSCYLEIKLYIPRHNLPPASYMQALPIRIIHKPDAPLSSPVTACPASISASTSTSVSQSESESVFVPPVSVSVLAAASASTSTSVSMPVSVAHTANPLHLFSTIASEVEKANY